MKATLFVFSILFLVASKAQVFPVINSNFTQPVSGSFNHFLLDSTNTLWQIGHSAKFDSVMSAKPALYTDTANAYPSNVEESVVIVLYSQGNDGPYHGYNFGFTSRFLTDSAQDGGYIEMSSDSGQSWVNILDYDSIPFPYPDGIFYFDFGGKDVELPNGQRSSFTGNGTTFYQNSIFIQFFMAIIAQPEGFTDPIYLRFSFYSDSLQSNKPGWQIDEFEIYGVYTYGVEERTLPIYVVPNPSNGIFEISSKNHLKTHFNVNNINGQSVLQGNIEGNSVRIDLSNQPSGTYLLRFEDGMAVKLIKQ